MANVISIRIEADGKAAIVETRKTADEVGKEMGSAGKSVDLLTGAFSRLGPAAIASVAGFTTGAMISQLHEAGKAAERLRNSFEAAAGSIHKGGAEQAYARAEAQRLGLDLLSTSQAYLKLTASAKGTALEGENTRAIFSSVAGAGRALGLSADEMSGALLAISQMMSKGTVNAEELRGQLSERLPGSFQIAARAMGVSTAELGKMLEKGEVVADDFLPRFAAELEKTFPAGEKAVSGLTAETERLKTAWFGLKTTVMDTGGESMFAGVARSMRWLTDEAERLVRTIMTLDNSRKPSSAPITKSDQALLFGDYNGVGPSGGASYLLGNGENIFAPSRPIPNPSEADAKAADKALAAANKARVSASAAGRAPAIVYSRQNDLLLKNIERYQRQLEIQSQELAALESTAGFDAQTFKTSNSYPTDRYNVTPLSQYRLLDNTPRSIPQAPPPERDPRAFDSLNNSMALASMDARGQSNMAEKTRMLMQLDERQKIIEEYYGKEVSLQAQKNAALAAADQEYADQKAAFDKFTMEQGIASIGQNLGQIGEIMMQGNKDQFEAGKAFAIASAIVNTYMAASAAFSGITSSTGGWGIAAAAVAAATAVATGMAQVAAIESTQYRGGRALGGPVEPGSTYLVGERGPELLTMGGQGGTVTPNSSLGGQRQEVRVTNVYQISTGVADTVRAEIMRAVPAITAHSVAAVGRAINSGGSLSAAVGRM